MGRKCSHCGNIGHNSRTCRGTSFRLFGVTMYASSSLSIVSMKKSFSMNCLSSSPQPSTGCASGYLSDNGLLPPTQERKKGVAWTEEEHRRFLMGLEEVGKGDWRGISSKYVTTRSPTQVASHAQKHFLRQASLNKNKRRSSLFDLVESRNMVVGEGNEAISSFTQDESIISDDHNETSSQDDPVLMSVISGIYSTKYHKTNYFDFILS